MFEKLKYSIKEMFVPINYHDRIIFLKILIRYPKHAIQSILEQNRIDNLYDKMAHR